MDKEVCIYFLRNELLRIALSKEKSVSSTNVFKLPKSHLLKGIKKRSCLPEINLGDDGMKGIRYTWPNNGEKKGKYTNQLTQIVRNLVVFTIYYFIWVLQLHYKAGTTINPILQIRKPSLRRVNNLCRVIQEINYQTRTIQLYLLLRDHIFTHAKILFEACCIQEQSNYQ